MTPTADDYREAVSNGAALLDVRVPGWRGRVDVLELDLASCEKCALGQLFGDYWTGLRHLTLADPSWDQQTARAATYGFEISPSLYDSAFDVRADHWSALLYAWVKEIQR